MKRILFLIFLTGCSQHSNNYPVANVPIQTAHAKTSVGSSRTEDFKVISDLLRNEIAESSAFLDLADKLVYVRREMGSEISLKECQALSSLVCPGPGDESRIYLNRVSLKNSQGVDAIAILSVETSIDLKQFLLNSANEVVEQSDSQENSFSVMSLTLEGNEISRLQKSSKDLKEALLFKGESIFVPKDKKITRASRTLQNDSGGENLLLFEIEMPGQGIHIFTGTQGNCSYGFIGTDDSRREFGELNCQDKMKVSTTLFN